MSHPFQPNTDSAEALLRAVSEGTAAVVGTDFFESLSRHLTQSLGIRYAMVTECLPPGSNSAHTIAYVDKGTLKPNFQYTLAGTPCELVLKGQPYYCPTNLETLFPREKGIQSYFAVPIHQSNGEIVGHLAVFDERPQEINASKLELLKIFASRAGAEIERKRKDHELHASMAQYKALFEDSPIGLSEDDFSDVKDHIDALKQKHNKPLSEIFSAHPREVDKCYLILRRLKSNKALISTFGFATEQEYHEYLRHYFRADEFTRLLLALDSGVLQYEREVQITPKSGGQKTLKIKRSILPGSETTWQKTVLSCVDITDQKEAQRNLQLALQEVKELKEQLQAENIYLQEEIKLSNNFEEIVSVSAEFKKVLQKVEQVAATDATVLILGESGTGKELIARAIHSISKRNNRPLVKVNCAALPANLIESELFGHEKGAFTGAFNQKIGRFELANGGTLFLDEIGELPLELQPKLLRVLQEGEFERVGGTKTLKVNVRIMAATNRQLELAVERKEFRADLFYRINVFPILSPPLRNRKDDIPYLVKHFCRKLQQGKKVNITSGTLNMLMGYDWPGNVRELQNVIERALIVSPPGKLVIGEWFVKPAQELATPETEPKNTSIQSIEREHILAVLNKTNWKVRGETGAAKILNLKPTTLEARMKKLGISKKF